VVTVFHSPNLSVQTPSETQSRSLAQTLFPQVQSSVSVVDPVTQSQNNENQHFFEVFLREKVFGNFPNTVPNPPKKERKRCIEPCLDGP